ncbi:MAG: hypothetical protein WDO17_25020 [Alphaproteobacteria bacterium]
MYRCAAIAAWRAGGRRHLGRADLSAKIGSIRAKFFGRDPGSEIFRNVKGCRYLVLKMLRMGGHLTQYDWNALELAQIV